jgi:hypothetical protein
MELMLGLANYKMEQLALCKRYLGIIALGDVDLDQKELAMMVGFRLPYARMIKRKKVY